MTGRRIRLAACVATLCLARGASPVAAQTEGAYWVYFRDKGEAPSLENARETLSARALDRRQRRGELVRGLSFEDASLEPSYVDAVKARARRMRHVSRWLNAVSVEAGEADLDAIAALPFVDRVARVRAYGGRVEPSVPTRRQTTTAGDGARAVASASMDYGASFGQLEQINVPALHAMGLDGSGVVVAVFDTGFKNLAHEALRRLEILSRWDFVNGDGTVGNNDDRGDGSHGSAVLSVLGGYAEGELVGPAYRATFLLAKTENTDSETPIEEDNWVAAVEWAEAWGADVISSSLGYLSFDPPFDGYTFEDMDGKTAVTTIAAQMAVERGIVVVTSAGNAGFHPEHNTLGAPADGALVLSIGAVDSFGERAEFSSVGRTADGRIKPDVMAQGALVRAADPATPDQYVLVDGTSFSCPLTAGVVALLLQAHPEWTPQRVRRALRSTADSATFPNRLTGWGILDALAAHRSP